MSFTLLKKINKLANERDFEVISQLSQYKGRQLGEVMPHLPTDLSMDQILRRYFRQDSTQKLSRGYVGSICAYFVLLGGSIQVNKVYQEELKWVLRD